MLKKKLSLTGKGKEVGGQGQKTVPINNKSSATPSKSFLAWQQK